MTMLLLSPCVIINTSNGKGDHQRPSARSTNERKHGIVYELRFRLRALLFFGFDVHRFRLGLFCFRLRGSVSALDAIASAITRQLKEFTELRTERCLVHH